ncbi:MAG: fructose-6-phosphate aldolase [Gemmatimonadetes bacterium]|nr:MAG: fructose-6-phosphate aldolase [Gemmatimonadota bacterium]
MRFFIDTANLEEIRAAAEMGLVDGVTTNPSLLAKEGRNPIEIFREICQIVDGPVSAEVGSTEYDGMMAEAHKLAEIHPNIVIKIPMTLDGLRAVRTLSEEGIKTNQTLCFSPSQAILSAKAGATYVSPFVGRLDDISSGGMDLIGQIITIYDNYDFETQVLVASIRHPMHLVEAALMGADVATIPYKVITQLIKHPLTDIGLQRFVDDWNTVKDLVQF